MILQEWCSNETSFPLKVTMLHLRIYVTGYLIIEINSQEEQLTLFRWYEQNYVHAKFCACQNLFLENRKEMGPADRGI